MNFRHAAAVCAWLTVALRVFAAGSAAWAEVRLPAIFSDHMVLERDAPGPVWGWAEPGENISIARRIQPSTAKYKVQLPPNEGFSKGWATTDATDGHG